MRDNPRHVMMLCSPSAFVHVFVTKTSFAKMANLIKSGVMAWACVRGIYMVNATE